MADLTAIRVLERLLERDVDRASPSHARVIGGAKRALSLRRGG
jgi:hypothetical protein